MRAESRAFAAQALLFVVTLVTAASSWALDLDEIKAKGVIRFAVYQDFAPFHLKGTGIDVDLADALARKLGVKLALLPFDADENMEDDLRNMVWKGHYLGYGPADVMLHAPVDAEYMKRLEQVTFFGPYFRDGLAVARNVKDVPELNSFADLAGKALAAEEASVSSIHLLGAEGGRLRERIRHFKTSAAAVTDGLLTGKVSAVMGPRSELEGALAGAKGYVVTPAPVLGRSKEWALGLAVKKGNEQLARALQAALNDLQAEGEVARIFARHGISYLAP